MTDKSKDTPTLRGRLNIYTMETGDGRDLELSVIEGYLCWRRVNDKDWVRLTPLSAFKPVKEIDYWTDEDQKEILESVKSLIGSKISHSDISDREKSDQHPIDSITNLRSELDLKVSRLTNPVSGNLVTLDAEGNLLDSGMSLSELRDDLELQERYVTKEDLAGYVTTDSLSSTLSEYSRVEYVDSLVSESLQRDVVLRDAENSDITIPEELVGYMNLYVYHNGVLLIRDTHYLAFRDHITLLDIPTDEGDIFSFVYVGSVFNTSNSDPSHPTSQENVIEVITVDDSPLLVSNRTVNIPRASVESLGVVKSSYEADKIRVNEDGTMSLNKVSFSNLINTDEELLLYSGGALS